MAKLNQNLDDANKKLNNLKAKFQSLKEQYESMSLNDAPLFFNPKEEQTAEQLEGHIKGMQVLIKEMKPDLQGISDIFKNTVNDLTKGNKELVRQRQALSKSSNLADQLLQIKKGETAATSKSISKIIEKLQLEKENLIYLARQKKLNGENRDELQSQISQLQGVIKAAEKLDEVYKRTNKKLGAGPQFLAGMDKTLQKLGLPPLGIDDALEETHKLAQEAEAAGEEFDESAAFTKTLTKNIKESLSLVNLMQLGIVQLVKTTKEVDKNTGAFAQDLDLSYKDSLKLTSQFTRISNLSGDAALNTKRLQQATQDMNSIMGTNAAINEKDLVTFTKLTRQAGLSKEELTGIFKQSLALGGSLEDNVNEFQRSAKIMSIQKGIAINTKTLMKDIGKIANVTKLSLQGGTEALAESMVRAKAVGLELSKMEGIANNLMDFESSITAELEAELLTGKQINLEKARQLALNNDLAGAAEEIAKQTGSAEQFSKMNRIQQEALAKAMGMSRDELGDMLFEQEALSKLNRKLTDEERRAFDIAKGTLGVEEASRMVKEDQLGELVKQQSLQDQLTDQVDHLKEIFVAMAPALTSIMELLGQVLGIVNLILIPFQMLFDFASGLGPLISKVIEPLGALKPLLKGIASLAVIFAAYKTAGAVAAGLAMTGIGAIAAPVVAGIASAGVLAAGFGVLSKVNDMVMPGDGSSGYGKRTITGPEGAIQLNNKDTVIAGTNLFDSGNKSKSPNTQTVASLDMSTTNAKLDAILAAIERGSIIEFKGTQLGETINQGERAIQ